MKKVYLNLDSQTIEKFRYKMKKGLKNSILGVAIASIAILLMYQHFQIKEFQYIRYMNLMLDGQEAETEDIKAELKETTEKMEALEENISWLKEKNPEERHAEIDTLLNELVED